MDKSWKEVFTAILTNAISISYQVRDMDIVNGKKVDKSTQDNMVKMYKDLRTKIKNDEPLTAAEISLLGIAISVVRIRLKSELAKMTASVKLMDEQVAPFFSDKALFANKEEIVAKFTEKVSVPMD